MIPLLLMLAATDAPAKTPVEAERAFAADAKTIGLWTAFRKWSTDDAVMFVPQPANAHDFLKDRKDPPKTIDWWPTASYISCDGKLAVNTGGWKRPDGKVGYFSTVWKRQPDDSWKWIVDGGDDLKVARNRPTTPRVTIARCLGKGDAVGTGAKAPGAKIASGRSDDGSLQWLWIVMPNGGRQFTVFSYNGKKLVTAIDDRIAAEK